MTRRHQTVVAVAALALAYCAPRQAPCWDPVALSRNGHALIIVGTFSSMQADAGGVVGAEVRIATADDPSYQATVQFGYGSVCKEPSTRDCFRVSNLYVLPVQFDYDRPHEPGTAPVTFEVPGPSPFAGRFEGWISHDGLRGTFTRMEGAPQTWFLKRGVPWTERF